MNELITQACYGAIASAVYATASYLKTQNNNDGGLENLDGWKLAKTIVLGAFVGGAASYFGITPEAVVALPSYGFVTMIVENALKTIKRRFG